VAAVSRVDRDGDVAVRVPGEPWLYMDVCVKSHNPVLARAARDGSAAAASAYAEKAPRRAVVASRGGAYAPIAVGAFGHLDPRSLAVLRRVAAAADDGDPIAPTGPVMTRPARAVGTVARAVVEGGAHGVLAVRKALCLPESPPDGTPYVSDALVVVRQTHLTTPGRDPRAGGVAAGRGGVVPRGPLPALLARGGCGGRGPVPPRAVGTGGSRGVARAADSDGGGASAADSSVCLHVE